MFISWVRDHVYTLMFWGFFFLVGLGQAREYSRSWCQKAWWLGRWDGWRVGATYDYQPWLQGTQQMTLYTGRGISSFLFTQIIYIFFASIYLNVQIVVLTCLCFFILFHTIEENAFIHSLLCIGLNIIIIHSFIVSCFFFFCDFYWHQPSFSVFLLSAGRVEAERDR